ncbi:MAG: hypothetical protein E7379_04495 [Clostridiales bacterium]|nr:hypothetical protein [Clostridiales bacterium]
MEENKNQLSTSQEVQQNVEVEITKEESPYKLYGQDISTTNTLIKDFYTESMKILVKSNLLVGDFDDKGNYIITKEIKRDIVVMDKEIEDKDEKFFKATSLYMKKNFYYFIPITKTDDGKAKAKLYLYEYVGDYLDKEFVVSHIATYLDEDSDEFMAKVQKAFNLVDVDVPNNDFETPNLAIRLQRMLNGQVRTKDLYENACQVFVKGMVDGLDNTANGKLILEEYKKLLASFKGTLTPSIQKALLDRVVNQYGGYEIALQDNAELKAAIDQFIMACKEIENLQEEKKEDAAIIPKADKPKASGTKKGGSAKKSEKKDDKKKAAKKGGGKDKKEEKKKSGGGVSLKELDKLEKMYRKLMGLDDKGEKKEEKPKKQIKLKEEKPEEKITPIPQPVEAQDEFVDEFDIQAVENFAAQTEKKETVAAQTKGEGEGSAKEGVDDPEKYAEAVEENFKTPENIVEKEAIKQSENTLGKEQDASQDENQLNDESKLKSKTNHQEIEDEHDKYSEEDFSYFY